MFDEPRRHPRYLVSLTLIVLCTIPFPFVDRAPIFFIGLPLWLWWSLAFSAALSGWTAWGILRLWRDDQHD